MTKQEKQIYERLEVCKFANHPMDEKYIEDVQYLLSTLDERDREVERLKKLVNRLERMRKRNYQKAELFERHYLRLRKALEEIHPYLTEEWLFDFVGKVLAGEESEQ